MVYGCVKVKPFYIISQLNHPCLALVSNLGKTMLAVKFVNNNLIASMLYDISAYVSCGCTITQTTKISVHKNIMSDIRGTMIR